MAHVRAQIRAAFVAALTGLATTGDRVYTLKTRPRRPEKLPMLIVTTPTEESERNSLGGDLSRGLTVIVDASADGAGVDDTLDDIAEEIEAAAPVDAGIRALSHDMLLTSTEFSFAGDGENDAGTMRMRFTVLYRTAKGSASANT